MAPWYNDVSRHFSDPWEAAGYALGGEQKDVRNYDEWYGEGAQNVDTSQFWHDQIAKGGRRL